MMISILKWLVMTVYNILPDSPFAQMVDNLELQQEFMQYLNWFLPIDIIGNMMLAWLDCILLYVLFKMVSWVLSVLLTSFIKSLTGFFSFFV